MSSTKNEAGWPNPLIPAFFSNFLVLWTIQRADIHKNTGFLTQRTGLTYEGGPEIRFQRFSSKMYTYSKRRAYGIFLTECLKINVVNQIL